MCDLTLSGWRFLSFWSAFPLLTLTKPHSSKVTSCLFPVHPNSACPSHLVLGLHISIVLLDFCKSHGFNTDRLLLPPMFTIAALLPVTWIRHLTLQLPSPLGCFRISMFRSDILAPSLLSEQLYCHKLSLLQQMSPVYLAYHPTDLLIETESHFWLSFLVFCSWSLISLLSQCLGDNAQLTSSLPLCPWFKHLLPSLWILPTSTLFIPQQPCWFFFISFNQFSKILN